MSDLQILLDKLEDLEVLNLPNTDKKAVWLDDVVNAIVEFYTEKE